MLNPTFDGNVTFTGNASFGDNDKAIFGDGSDLQIYHDGSNSYIDDAGTGLLAIRANTGVYLQKYTGETLATFVADGGAAIYHDNAAKLATTSTGISVTGGITTDAYSYLNGLRIAGADTGNTVYQQSGDLSISSASGSISLKPSGTNILHATNTGVGIGTSSPTLPLDIVSNPGADALKIRARPNGNDYGTLTFYNNAGTTKWADIQSNVAKDLRFYTNGGSEAMRIDASGNVGIGTTPSATHSAFDTIEFETASIISQNTATGGASPDGNLVLGSNMNYSSGGGPEYKVTGKSTQITQIDGNITLGVATSGTANTSITYNTGLEVLNDGYARAKNGLLFGTDTAAANALNDYEEGTWTPSLQSAPGGISTADSAHNHYVKIGNIVHLQLYVALNTSSSSSAALVIEGLPFTPLTNQATAGSMIVRYGSSSTYAPYISGARIEFYRVDNTGNWILMNYSNVGQFHAHIGITYQT